MSGAETRLGGKPVWPNPYITGTIQDIGGKWTLDIGDDPILFINQDADAKGIHVDTESANNYGILVNGKWCGNYIQDVSGGIGFDVERNIAEAGSFPLVRLRNRNANNTQPTLALGNTGTGGHLSTSSTDETLVIAPNGTGSIRLDATVITDTNTDLAFLPSGTGITKIGDAGAAGNLGTPTNDDVFIAGRLEVDGVLYADAGITIEAANIATDTTTGMQIATAADQKVGFYGLTPVVQPVHVADPAAAAATTATQPGTGADGTTWTGAQCTAAYNDLVALKAAADANNAAIDSILAQLATLGLQANA